jgi:drug/metabolite transporter (DMT)-like permease
MNSASSSSRPNSNSDSGSGKLQYKPLKMVISEIMPQTAAIESWTSLKTARKRPSSSPIPSSSVLMVEKGTCLTVVAAWTSMALAVLSGASIGPMFKYMHGNGIPIILAAAWRCQCMLIFLIPLGIAESVLMPEGKVEWFARKPGLPYQVYVHILFASIYWAANLTCWIEGLKFVSTVTASLLASTHPLMLVIYLRFVGQPVSKIEVVGMLIALFGIVVTSSTGYFRASETDDSLERGKYEVHPTIPEEIFGCILCLLAAAAEVGVIVNRAVTKKYVPLMQYSAATSIGVTICVSMMSIVLEGSSVVGICNNCVFGWVRLLYITP